MDIKELCMSLIRCDDEDEAIEILRGAGYWDDVSLWRDFGDNDNNYSTCLLYTSPSPRDRQKSRMPSSA